MFQLLFLGLIVSGCAGAQEQQPAALQHFTADNPLIRYTGRIDFSDIKRPKFWQPGVYVEFAFEGSRCELILEDEVLWGSSHNYFQLVVDGKETRTQLKTKRDTILVADGLGRGVHQVTLSKNTEAGIGFMSLAGIHCNKLVQLPPAPERKIEFIGNSITCGMGSDESEIACDKGVWYDQHNAYRSYGAITARTLKAQYHLSSVSGIGLIHSCCEMKTTMPQVFDKINMRGDSITWDFNKYQPDVVTVCLGQNDGIQDSLLFCDNYIRFIKTLRKNYPFARIVLLTSPMANPELNAVMKKYIRAIVAERRNEDERVHDFFFSKRYSKGCGEHPSLEEHGEIAAELTDFLRDLMKW